MTKKELALKLYIKLLVARREESGLLVRKNEKGEEYYEVDEEEMKRCIATASELLNTYDKIVGYGPHKVQ